MTEFSTHDRGRAGAAARTRDRSAGPGPPRRRGRRDASDVGRDGVAGRESQSGRRVARRHSPVPRPRPSTQSTVHRREGAGRGARSCLKLETPTKLYVLSRFSGDAHKQTRLENAPKQQTRLSRPGASRALLALRHVWYLSLSFLRRRALVCAVHPAPRLLRSLT